LLNCYGVRCRLSVNKVDHYKETARSTRQREQQLEAEYNKQEKTAKSMRKARNIVTTAREQQTSKESPPGLWPAPRLFKCLSEASKEKWSKAERS
jgi:hypothetical protein